MGSKRDPVINQVPIATKQALLNYGTLIKLLAVTKCKEELTYKPDYPNLAQRNIKGNSNQDNPQGNDSKIGCK